MIELTVGYLAGFIAFAVFVARIWSPNAITFVLSGILRDKNSASTWTAASTALQRSLWPWVLQSDSAQNHRVRKDILSLTWFISFMSFVIAVAGVITPLGLYETLIAGKNTFTPFYYLKDTSAFSFGTPLRSDMSFNRICWITGTMIPCPFSNTVIVFTENSTRSIATYPKGYDIKIPDSLREVYSSGTGDNSTICNYFDIEWRRYQIKVDKLHSETNNGSTYIVGSNRIIQSLILNDAIELVEGLLVDTKNGSVGFRNHTVPKGFGQGVAWEEDLLFVEPETVCVNTNVTLDFDISIDGQNVYGYGNPVLVDAGGFVNLNRTWPEVDISNPQHDPKLRERAYKAAWMLNAYTMLFYNITTQRNATNGHQAFQYLNSKIGAKFFLPNQMLAGWYDAMSINNNWGNLHDIAVPRTERYAIEADLPLPTNPFGITSANFTDIASDCTGTTSVSKANITNALVICGMMRGVPIRVGPGPSTLLEDKSRWSQPIYACASAVKATIKQVSFTYNGTAGIKSLHVDKVEPKRYPEKQPLWGVEYSGNRYNNSQIDLLWGLVADKYENHRNVSTVRKESLYLHGYGLAPGINSLHPQNLPASTFYNEALATAYQVGPVLINTPIVVDYSGRQNIGHWAKWQILSANATTAAQIPNLIWADYVASTVVGTRGVLGWRNLSPSNTVRVPVFPTEKRIRYHLPFAIPAIIALLGLIVVTVGALLTVLLKHHNITAMRHQLQKLSPGRIFTTFLHPELGGMTVPSKEWSKTMGNTVIDVTGDYPQSAGVVVPLVGIGEGEERRGPTVLDTSASDGSTERDQFLGRQSPRIPEPYTGAQDHSSVSPVTPRRSPEASGRYL